jgi:hypothetical protein
LQRHNAVAAALEALGAAIVHPVGQPINHSVKAGFKRRGEVWVVLDDVCPSWVGWACGEKWCTAMSALLICGSLGLRVPSTMGGLLLCSITCAFGVGQLLACSRMSGPIFPLL